MSNANRAVGLRRSVLDAKSRRKTGTGGWRGSWKDRMDIPKAETTDILLTRGEYVDPEIVTEDGEPGFAHFHTCKQHSVKLGAKGGSGSFYMKRCNIDAGQDDCLLCKKQQEGDRRIMLKSVFSFNCIHLALHEQVPAERDGKVLKYENDTGKHKRGDTVMQWDLVDKPKRRKEVLGDIDEMLKHGEAALFRKKYIEVGAGHRDELSAIDEKASHICKCGGALTPVLFTCEKCEEVLADVDADDMSAKMIADFSQSREKCKKCKHIGLPVPEMVCDSCANPAPLSAFDVVATIRKEGEGQQSHIVVSKITPIDQYRLPNGASLIEWFKNKKGEYEPDFDDNDNFIFTEEFDIKKTVEAQFNFEDVHAPAEHGFHAQKLGCENPFGSSNDGGSKYKRYGESGSAVRVSDDKEEGRGRGRSRDADEPDDTPPARGRGRDDEGPSGRRRQAR